MKKLLIVSLGALLLANTSAHAIDAKYREKLERSGCTQVTEMQGCDINKTKAENAKAGFGAPSHEKHSAAPQYKDLAGKDSIKAIDIMASRGFKNVDDIESGNSSYGIFYHPQSRLCIQLAMANGKVVSADDIKTHPNCR
jgi:hypothetical protein